MVLKHPSGNALITQAHGKYNGASLLTIQWQRVKEKAFGYSFRYTEQSGAHSVQNARIQS